MINSIYNYTVKNTPVKFIFFANFTKMFNGAGTKFY